MPSVIVIELPKYNLPSYYFVDCENVAIVRSSLLDFKLRTYRANFTLMKASSQREGKKKKKTIDRIRILFSHRLFNDSSLSYTYQQDPLF